MLMEISLLLNGIFTILLAVLLYLFNRIVNNHEELIYLLRDDVNEMKQYVLIPEHINCRCETGVVFENDKRES